MASDTIVPESTRRIANFIMVKREITQTASMYMRTITDVQKILN